MTENEQYAHIVFDGPPGPVPQLFVDVEDEAGASIAYGEWIEHPTSEGFWVLRVPRLDLDASLRAARALSALKRAAEGVGGGLKLNRDGAEPGTVYAEEWAVDALALALDGHDEEAVALCVSATETGASDGTRDSHTGRGWRGRGERG